MTLDSIRRIAGRAVPRLLGLIPLAAAAAAAAQGVPPAGPSQTGAGARVSPAQVSVAGNEQWIRGLREGWNLVSFSVLPEDRTPGSVLIELRSGGEPVALTDRVESLWTYDTQTAAWLSWLPGGQFNNMPGFGIAEVEYGKAYWLKMKSGGADLRVAGSRPADGRLTLYEGWNLVAFDGGEPDGEFLASIEAVFGGAIDLAEPENSRIQSVYFLSNIPGEPPSVWDPFNDRPEGDAALNLPPGNEPGQPNEDTLLTLARGAGYWVRVAPGDPVELIPLLQTRLLGDSNLAPDSFPGPEDIDLDGDGVLDRADWTHPEEESASIQDTIFIPKEANEREILVRNAGDGILYWEAEVDPAAASWLSIEPTQGRLLNTPQRISVKADRGRRTGPAELTGIIRVTSTGGARTVNVNAAIAGLEGTYEGMAQIRHVDGKQIDNPSIQLQLSLDTAPDGTLRGAIFSEGSISIPFDVPLAGDEYRPGTSDFVFNGAYALPGSGRDAYDINDPNPLPNDLQREFHFRGTRVDENAIAGELLDTIHGILERPVKLRGPFRLTRVDHDPKNLREAFRWDPVGGPFGTETKRYPIAVEDRVYVESLSVGVDIEHPDASQLSVWLEAPAQGNEPPIRVQLHANAPGVNLTATWPDTRFPAGGPGALDAFKGIIGQGTWILEVTDSQDGPGGSQRLRGVSLDIEGPNVFTLGGQVIHADTGNPVPNAMVAVMGGTHTRYRIAGDDGRFEFDYLTPNLYKVTASKYGYRIPPAMEPVSVFLSGRPEETHVLILPLARTDPGGSFKLQFSPRLGYEGTPVRAWITPDLAISGEERYRFELLRRDPATGEFDPEPAVREYAGTPGSVEFVHGDFGPLPAGLYYPTYRVLASNGDELFVIVDSRPIAILPHPHNTQSGEDGRPAFRFAGMVGGAGGGAVPGTYNASEPPITNLELNEGMVDASTFDNNRLADDGPFPAAGVDTDVRQVAPVPRADISVNGVGRISYALFEGQGGGDLTELPCSEIEGQTWKCYRFTASIGSRFAGFSSGGAFSMAGGGRPFPPGWTPNGGTQE